MKVAAFPGIILLSGLMGADGGVEPVHLVEAGGGARQPQVAVADGGRVFVAFGAGDAIRCVASADGGKTFGPPAEVGTGGVLALGMRRGPRVAAPRGAVVVTAVAGKVGKGRDGDVLAWRSADDGRTWAGPTRVNAVEGSAREGLHGMAAGPDGSVLCAWLDLRNRRTEIYAARSADGGATWGPDRLAYRAPEKSVCECCHPSVACGPDGSAWVMWRNNVAGARDLYLARSADGGRTFGAAEPLGRGTWPLKLCPMDGGAVAAGPGGRVETAWMRDGSVFTAAPGRPERRLGPGVQPWIAAGPGGAYVAWLARRGGPLEVDRPGATGPEPLADAANDPVVAAGPGGRGPVVAAWEAGGPAGPGGIDLAVLAPADTDDAPEAPKPGEK